jgi:predicted nucleic acid-binding protein
MADVALDANVLVAWFDEADVLHGKAKELLYRLRNAGDAPVFLDVCLGEAVSVAAAVRGSGRRIRRTWTRF